MGKKKKGKWDMEPQKSSAAQYLTYIASYGVTDEKFEIRYEDENIWMSQKMLAAVYGVEVPNIAYHLRKLFADGEIDKDSVIKEILITGPDGKNYRVNHYKFLEMFDQHPPKYSGDPIDAYRAQLYAECEFEKYRPIQDQLFMSDYDRFLLALEEEAKRAKGEADEGGGK